MARMMNATYKIQAGRVQGHGSWCADCKPDEPKGRTAETRDWMAFEREAERDE